MSDDWSYWRAALAGRELPPLHEGEAHIGYYRTKNRDGAMVGVAIWKDDNGVVWAQAGGSPETSDPERVYAVFSRACRHPVTYQAWQKWVVDKVWPDIDPAAAKVAAANGRNEAGLDEETQLLDNLAEIKAAIERFDKIRTEEELSRVAGLRDSAGKIGRALEKMREAKKAPHLAAGNAVDAHFRPLKERAAAVDKEAKALLDAWANEKLREQRAAEAAAAKKAAEEAAARQAEIDRLAALAKAGEEDALDELLEAQKAKLEADAAAPAPAPILPQRVQTGVGRAASVRIKRVARIVDPGKLLTRYATRSEMLDLLLKLAQAEVDAGVVPPGVEVDERAETRR